MPRLVWCNLPNRTDIYVTGAISPALSMHPGIPPHLQQLQAHLLRSGGLLPPLHPQPGLYHPLSSPAELLNPKQEVKIFSELIFRKRLQ